MSNIMSTITDFLTGAAEETYRFIAKIPLLDDILNAGEKIYTAVSRAAFFNDDKELAAHEKPSTGGKAWGFLLGSLAGLTVLFGYVLINPLLLQVYLPYKLTKATKNPTIGMVVSFIAALATAIFMPYLFPIMVHGLANAPILGHLSSAFSWSASISTLGQINQAGQLPFWKFFFPMLFGFAATGVASMFTSSTPGSDPVDRARHAASLQAPPPRDNDPPLTARPRPGQGPKPRPTTGSNPHRTLPRSSTGATPITNQTDSKRAGQSSPTDSRTSSPLHSPTSMRGSRHSASHFGSSGKNHTHLETKARDSNREHKGKEERSGGLGLRMNSSNDDSD